jgi:hypothetical protein
MLTVELNWLSVGLFTAGLTLCGAGSAWKADKRSWSEQFGENPRPTWKRRWPGSSLIWTGMPPVDAEILVEGDGRGRRSG